MLNNGAKIVCFAVVNPGRDIFLKMLEAVVRFIGMGTGNKGLYIGGVCLVSAMALAQLGNIRGARKRLGQ